MADQPDPGSPRQRVVRVPGSRRARLTPVPGSDPDPESGPAVVEKVARTVRGPKGPNDDQLIQDVPPHY